MNHISRKQATFIHIALLTISLLLLAWAAISSLTFISSDTGLRFLQIRELIKHQWQTFAIDYPAQILDSTWQFTPYYHSYSLIDNQLYFNISHFFPLLASFLGAAFGSVGLAIVPALGGILTAVAVYRLGILADVKYPRLLLWATVFGTPLLIYSLELWDHSIAAACAVWSLYGMALGIMQDRWQPLVLGGIALGIGLGQRPEMYPFAIALGGALLITTWTHWQKWVTFVGGAVVATLPVWFLQYRWVGHPLGLAFAPNLFGYGRPDAYPVLVYNPINTTILRISHWLLHVESHDLLTFMAALLLILGIFIFVFSLRVPAFHRPRWVWISLLLNLLGYVIYILQAERTLLHGFITTFPLIAFLPAYLDQAQDRSPSRPVYHLVLATTLLFLGVMFAFWPAFGGVQWGVRYMLPAYPLLLFIAFYVFTGWQKKTEERPYTRALNIAFIVLIATSFVLQAMGTRYLFRQHRTQEATRNMIAELSVDLIMTNDPFLASNMASLTDKWFMYVFDEQDTLVPRLAQNNIHHFAIVDNKSTPINVPEQVGIIQLKQVSDSVYELEMKTP